MSTWNDLPEFVKQAAKETNHEDPGQVISSFINTWGGYAPDTLQCVLLEGSGDDRVFAITALGLLDSSDHVESLILPFLQSKDEKERWASTIALGRHKHEHVFPLLQDLLVENILDYENFSLFDWQLYRRCTIALLLGEWGRPQAVVALRRAFHTCWEIEQQSDLAAEPGRVDDHTQWWHFFQDHLAYALGQLGAWGAISTLGLSTAHMRVAIIFMSLGSLHLNAQRIFALGRAPQIFDQSHYRPSTLALFASNPDSPLFAEPEIVARILLERFGLSETEQMQYIQGFARNYRIGRLEEDKYVPPDGLVSNPF
jgi:hypothetical protein